LIEVPTGEAFGDGIEEGDDGILVGGDDRVTDGFDGGGEPAFDPAEFALNFVFAEGQIDAGA
jgi:hypothetical protein